MGIPLKRDWLVRVLAALTILLLGQGAIAQTSLNVNPLTPPNTQSPRQTLTQFLNNMNEAYTILVEAQLQSKLERGIFHSPEIRQMEAKAEETIERAIRTLNLEEVPTATRQLVGLESALLLKEVFDRLELPAFTEIPDISEVRGNSAYDRWEIPQTEIAIARVSEGMYQGEYLFSPDTVRRVKDFYREVRDLPYQSFKDVSENFYQFYISTPGSLLPPKWSNWIPNWSKQIYLEQTIWQWFVFLATVAIACVSTLGIYRWQRRYDRILKSPQNAWFALFLPASTTLALGIVHYLTEKWINITGIIYEIFLFCVGGALFLLGAWSAFVVMNAIAQTALRSGYLTDRLIDESLVRIGFRLLGILISVTILYRGALHLGLPVAPLVASLGIGSVALGFGAQSFFQNLLGGITLFADRSVRVGDFCEFGGITGIVEEIGLRSTRIRTMERHLVSVPNATFSTSQLINYSKQDYRLFNVTMGLRYETTREQLRELLMQFRNLLEAQELVTNERVRFVGLGNYSLNIEIFAYILTTDLGEYLEIQEALLLKMMEMVEQVGTFLAYPSQTLYLSRDR